MNICIVSKYPPIEGGISSKTYWLAKGLGEMGHKVFIVTNCQEVEEEWREEINRNERSFLEPKNVKLISTNTDFRPPILRSHYFVARIASLAVNVIRRYNIDVIYSHYLLPYSVAALLAKQITKKPLFVRHAGSDMARLYKDFSLADIFTEVFKGADKIMDSPQVRGMAENQGIDISGKLVSTREGVNNEEFHPGVGPFSLSRYTKKKIRNVPIFSYFGKISPLKQTYSFVRAAAEIKNEEFLLLFVAGEEQRAKELQNYANFLGVKERCIFLPFQPPWKIPSLMTASTCVVCPESSEAPFLPRGTHFPQMAREAMACGKCTIMGKGVAEKGVYTHLQNGVNTLIINPLDTHEFAKTLKIIVKNPNLASKIGQNARKFSEKVEDFNNYLQSMIEILKSLI